MPTSLRTPRELRQIARGLAKGELLSDWMNQNDAHPEGISLLSEVEQLILQTQDIGMRFERKENAMEETEEGHLIFSTFEILTTEEALQVAEMILRYDGFLTTYREVIIPHE